MMAQEWRFTELRSDWIGDKWYRITAEFQYLHPTEGLFSTPEGRVTDFDSVPRIPLVYAYAKGRTRYAAAVHDELYLRRERRRWADKIFWDAMGHEGVPNRYRWPIWLGVRSGGWLAYRRKAKTDDAKG